MSVKKFNTRIQLKHDVNSDGLGWASTGTGIGANLQLLAGEFAWDSTNQNFKIGTGSAAFSALDYAIPAFGNTFTSSKASGLTTYNVKVDDSSIKIDTNTGALYAVAAATPGKLSIGSMEFDGSTNKSVTLGNGLAFNPASSATDTIAINLVPETNGYITVSQNGINVTNIDSNYTTANTTNLATVATVTAALGTLDVNEFALASVSSNVVTIKGIKEVDGKIAVGDGAGISLEEVAYTGAAADVSIADAGNYYTTDTVEAALQEIGATINTGVVNSFANETGDITIDTTYLKMTSKQLGVDNVDTAGTSTTATDLATVKTVTEHIGALDGSHTVTAGIVNYSGSTTGAQATKEMVIKGATEADGVLSTNSSADATLYFTKAVTDTDPLVVKSDLSGIVGAMVYRGTVDETHPLPDSPSTGDVYVAADDGTYAGKAAQTGDMFVYDGTNWNLIQGTVNVSNGNPTIVAGAGTASTIGTVEGVALTAQVNVTAGSATIASVSDGVVTITPTVAQAANTGTIQAASGTAITLAKVATTGAAADVSIADAGSLIDATTVEGALQEIAGKSNTALQSISHGTDGSYVTTTIGTKTNNDQSIGVAVTVQAVSTADSTHMGLAEASDVKSYVDGKVNDLDSVADADDTTAQTGHATITATTPSADFKVLNSVTETDGKLVSGEAYNLKKVAATGAAADLSYDNSTSQMTATTTQGALDEIAAWDLILDCGSATQVVHTQA